MAWTASSVARKRAGAEGSRFGADFVLLDPAGKMLRGLNPSAERGWELCDGRFTAAEVARCLAMEFDVSEAQALADLIPFLERLERHGLLEAPG